MEKSMKSNSSSEKTITRDRMTPIQLQMLVDIISVNPELINGKLNSNFSQADRKNKWMALAALLNSKGLGPVKDADRWRKTWSDLKFTVRSKAAKMELEGGVEYMCKRLTNTEKRVLQMIGDVSVSINPEDDLNESSISSASTANISSLSVSDSKSKKSLVLPVWNENSDLTKKNVLIRGEKADNRSQNSVDEEDADDPDVSYVTDNNYDNTNDANEDDDDDDEDEDGDDDDTLDETFSAPPMKKRKLLKKNNVEVSPTVITVQRHIQLQTEVLKEHTSILRDISRSLQIIAKALSSDK